MQKLQRFIILLTVSVAACLQVQRCNAQSGGMYLPTVTKGYNANIYSADSAHFIQVGDQCTVYGHFTIANYDSVGAVYVRITAPLPMLYNVHNTRVGNCFVFDPNHLPAAAPVTGWITASFNHNLQLMFYTAQSGSFAAVDYFFTYKIVQ